MQPDDGASQAREVLHACPVAQLVHELPPVPQAAVSVPATHVPFWQQPLEQFPGPQPVMAATHWPDWQSCPETQTSQLNPPVPHAPVDVPASQTPADVQHPLQFDVPHGGPQPINIDAEIKPAPTKSRITMAEASPFPKLGSPSVATEMGRPA